MVVFPVIQIYSQHIFVSWTRERFKCSVPFLEIQSFHGNNIPRTQKQYPNFSLTLFAKCTGVYNQRAAHHVAECV